MNDHQKEQRERTIKAISDAVEYLKSKGIKLTYRAIAEEADLSISTVLKTPIKNFLIEKYGFSGKVTEEQTLIEELKSENKRLRERLSNARLTEAKAQNERDHAKNDLATMEQKYKELLFKYAVNIDKKITSIR